MLKAKFAFLAFAFCLFGWALYAAIPPLPLSVALKTEQTSFKFGAPIKIEIILTNMSHDTVDDFYPLGGNAFGFFKVYVRNVNGEAVPKTPVQLRDETDTHPISFSAMERKLKPGDTEIEWFMLNELFDLSTPGTYIVQVERGWYDDPAVQPALKSNPITITVTP